MYDKVFNALQTIWGIFRRIYGFCRDLLKQVNKSPAEGSTDDKTVQKSKRKKLFIIFGIIVLIILCCFGVRGCGGGEPAADGGGVGIVGKYGENQQQLFDRIGSAQKSAEEAGRTADGIRGAIGQQQEQITGINTDQSRITDTVETIKAGANDINSRLGKLKELAERQREIISAKRRILGEPGKGTTEKN